MRELAIRTVFATIYAGVIIASVLLDPLYFGLVIGIIAILGVREFHKLMHSSKILTFEACLTACCVPLYAFLNVYNHAFCEEYLQWIFAGLIVAILTAELFWKAENPIHNWGVFLTGTVMILVPFYTMINICNESKFCLLALFVTIWINDSGAYCVGKMMSQREGLTHKMFPRVSPNKTWEGLMGGIVFAVVGGIILEHYDWIEKGWLFGLIVAIVGTLGDLMESLMKRTLGVKDSGKFMPGHGGVLDRFDSILLASVVIYIVYYGL